MTNPYQMQDLTVEITKKCPMNCTICSSNGGERDPAELSLSELRHVVDEAKQLGTTTISLSGGEPLESPFAIDFIRYVKKSGLKLYLYSCGNLSSDNKISAIPKDTLTVLKSLSVDKIVFSIHGPNAEIHERITNRTRSFDNLITSIKRAQECNHVIELHFVPVLSNYESLPEVCNLAEKLGIQQLSVLRFVPQGRGAINRKGLDITGKNIQRLEEILKDVHQNSSIQLRFGSPFNCFNIDNRTKCSAGIDKATLRPDGFLYPCVSLKKVIFEDTDNNIRKRSMEWIWNHSRLFNLIRSFHNLVERSNCKKCENFKDCGGGCITQRLIISDDVSSNIDPYCKKTTSNQTGTHHLSTRMNLEGIV